MSDFVIFSIGAVLFVATSAATLLVGYLRFKQLQEEDAARRVEESSGSL